MPMWKSLIGNLKVAIHPVTYKILPHRHVVRTVVYVVVFLDLFALRNTIPHYLVWNGIKFLHFVSIFHIHHDKAK